MPTYDLEKLVKNEDLKKGDIMLVHVPFRPIKDPMSFLSLAIRKITSSYWNHSVMYVGGGEIVEANMPGVEKLPITKYSDYDVSFWRHKERSYINMDKVTNDALNSVGTKYDIKQLFNLLYLFATGQRHRKDVYAGRTNKLICSEVTSKPYYDQNFPVVKKYSYDKITPADFSRSIYFTRKDFEGRIISEE